jgi:hypothetical protein
MILKNYMIYILNLREHKFKDKVIMKNFKIRFRIKV